jgi:hypothetical protein
VNAFVGRSGWFLVLLAEIQIADLAGGSTRIIARILAVLSIAILALSFRGNASGRRENRDGMEYLRDAELRRRERWEA